MKYMVDINNKTVYSTNSIEKAYEVFYSLQDFAEFTGAHIQIWAGEVTIEDFFGN
jgi:hypothetical protein